jgi:hypothetical protein
VAAGPLSSRAASAETEGAGAETQAQGASRRKFEGTVTWFDAARKLVVLQEGGKPTSWGILSRFEAATNGVEYFLARARGFLHPPVTGNYTFWIASDDSSELWLSEDDDAAKARRIASVGIGRWTEPKQWTRYPSQQSAEIRLEAGRAYYIEALHQQSTGMDCLAVAWQGPGIERGVIDGRYLSPGVSPGDRPVLAMVSGSTNGILREYWKDFFSADLASLRKSDAFILNLWQARLFERQKSKLPKPVRIPAEEPLGFEENFRWVEVDGYARYAGSAGRELDLEVKDGRAHIRVQIGGNSAGPFSFPENSPVRIRGVYESVAGPNKELPAGILWVNGRTNIHWRDTPENGDQ